MCAVEKLRCAVLEHQRRDLVSRCSSRKAASNPRLLREGRAGCVDDFTERFAMRSAARAYTAQKPAVKMEIRARLPRLRAILAAAMLIASRASVVAGASVVLPVEVVGENGTTSSVTVEVPARRAREVRSLWMQIHGLSYADMVSVQVNKGSWFSLNNATVAVAEPGKSYGGIGGGFSTLKVTLALPADAVVEGANSIQFRFNQSNGVVSGFRVVAFNLLTGDSSKVLEPDAFTQEDPDTWTPPLRDPGSMRAGQELWLSAQLRASTLPNAPQIRAHCSDCHAYDGRDLKYFG